jgi:hypothetical protein
MYIILYIFPEFILAIEENLTHPKGEWFSVAEQQ